MARVYIDHISLVVQDLQKAVADWRDILNVVSPGHTIQITWGSGVTNGTLIEWATFQNPDPEGVSLQVWTSPAKDGWVQKLLAKRGEYVHHIAFVSDDFGHTVEQCRQAGLPVLQEEDGYPDSMPWLRWNFISAEKAHGPLIELATRYLVVRDKWMPHPNNAENGFLAEELERRYYPKT